MHLYKRKDWLQLQQSHIPSCSVSNMMFHLNANFTKHTLIQRKTHQLLNISCLHVVASTTKRREHKRAFTTYLYIVNTQQLVLGAILSLLIEVRGAHQGGNTDGMSSKNDVNGTWMTSQTISSHPYSTEYKNNKIWSRSQICEARVLMCKTDRRCNDL